MLFLAKRLDIGLAILVFFFPFLGFVIDLSGVSAVRDVPFLNQLNAPFVDIFGILLFTAWLLTIIKSLSDSPFFKGREPLAAPFGKGGLRGIFKEFSHLQFFLPFLLSAAVSLKNVPTNFFTASVKYFARPVAFFYFAFFVPTVSILKKYGEEFAWQILWIFYGTGMLSALMGLVSLFVVNFEGFPRAMPFAVLGFAPLGTNHNLLAETLVATVPVGFLLWRKSGKLPVLAGTLLQALIVLLTFARTAWIALATELALLILFIAWGQKGRGLRKEDIFAALRRVLPVAATVGFLVVLLAVFMSLTLFSEVVQSSTLTRLDMARIAWFYFLREPLFGQGVGTFIPTLWGVKAFLLDYGEPLEAHGIVWKLMFEQGVAGLLTYAVFSLSILAGIGRALWRKRSEMLACMFILAAGSFTYQLFNTTYYTSKLWVPVGIAVGIASIARAQVKSVK